MKSNKTVQSVIRFKNILWIIFVITYIVTIMPPTIVDIDLRISETLNASVIYFKLAFNVCIVSWFLLKGQINT